MFVAMNVFSCEDAESAKNLEGMFLKRAGLVEKQAGFLQFAFLKCAEDPKKLISMSHWRSKEDFDAWTKSRAFEEGHRRAKESGQPSPHGAMKLANKLETFEVLSHAGPGGSADSAR